MISPFLLRVLYRLGLTNLSAGEVEKYQSLGSASQAESAPPTQAPAAAPAVSARSGFQLQFQDVRQQIQQASAIFRNPALAETVDLGELKTMMSAISEQTNLLVLNAAIKAASAAAGGEEFSLISAEARRLADRSVEAASQIGVLRDSAQKNTETELVEVWAEAIPADAGDFASDALVCGDSVGIAEISLGLGNLIQDLSSYTQARISDPAEVEKIEIETVFAITAMVADNMVSMESAIERIEALAPYRPAAGE